MDKDGKLYIEIRTESENDLLEDIKNLQLPPRPIKYKEDNSEPVILMNSTPKIKKKKEKKNKKGTLSTISSDMDLDVYEEEPLTEEELDEREQSLLDIEEIMERKKKSEDDDIVKTQKKGYKKLKEHKNAYKKEFAEEITLLYNLLDETTKFSKSIEKELNGMRSTKVRGASKYSTELTEIVLSSKQTKLNILKEIASIKKNIADLAQKAEKNTKNDEDSINKNERLAAAYFKNILSHGRSNFIQSIERPTDDDEYFIPDTSDDNNGFVDREELEYSRKLEERLDGIVNPFRSEAGSKYIEYEQRGVTVEVHKCVDTGEWDFVAIDKEGEIVEDYPVPTKKSAGRVRFSDDGTYCTDSLGRMYKVYQYYLPDDEEE